MSLIEQIQNEAVDSKSDLGAMLRKCKLLAARLGSEPLEEWLILESNGYPTGADLPEYRVWALHLKGQFWGGGSAATNVPIPFFSVPPEMRERVLYYRCYVSIAGIEQLVSRDEGEKVLRVTVSDLATQLTDKVVQDHSCIEAWGEFGKSQFIEVLNSVRNRILDFTIALQKEAPMVSEDNANPERIEPSKVTQIFNTTVHGGSANILGTASRSTVSFNIQAHDFSSLELALREKGINEEDIVELGEALQAESSPPGPGTFGPRVSDWISKMIGKSATGSWQVGIGAAGGFLGDVIGKYYGF